MRTPSEILYTEFEAALNACPYFEPSPHIAVAVSGGADSMTTALLAQQWTTKRNSSLTALTVNHGIRPEAAKECETTKTWLDQHGITCHILNNTKPPPTSNMMAEARNIRYTLLKAWCYEHSVLHLLTGHHQNDQQETLLMREERGSSTWGMCGMAPVSLNEQTRILRPLLNTPKQACIDLLNEKNQPWIEDPTNQNTKYTRNRIRQNTQKTTEEHNTQTHQETRANEEATLTIWLKNHTQIYPQGFLEIDHTAFKSLDKPLALRCLKHSLNTINANNNEIRIHELEQLHNDLTSSTTPYKGSTLHGCKLEITAVKNIRCFRELSRIKQQLLEHPTTIFDKRFRIHTTSEKNNTYILSPLGKAGWESIKPHLPKQNLPPRVLYTLPCIKIQKDNLEIVVTVPHIHYNSTIYPMRMECVFIGAAPLAPLPFNWYVQQP